MFLFYMKYPIKAKGNGHELVNFWFLRLNKDSYGENSENFPNIQGNWFLVSL